MQEMARPTNQRLHRPLTTTIPQEDWAYCKEKGLSFQSLLMGAIRDHRVHANNPDAEPTTREMVKKIRRLSSIIQQNLEFINEKGLFDDWANYGKSLNS